MFPEDSTCAGGFFPKTSWGQVLATRGSDPAQASEAWENLCRAYWYPLYVYARHRGHLSEEAKDLTQGFFAQAVRRNLFAAVAPGCSRFRAFILAAFKNYMVSEWRRDHAEKRGGNAPVESLDLDSMERRFIERSQDSVTPEAAYDRHWAEAVLERALGRLELEQDAAGKGSHFEALVSCLTGAEEHQPYRVVADRLGMTETAVKTVAHRLRRRYGELLRFEVAQTVATPAEVDEELRHLLTAVAACPTCL